MPAVRDSNPYIENLIHALGDVGWQVAFSSRSLLWKRLVDAGTRRTVVHVHWVQHFWAHRNSLRAVLEWGFLHRLLRKVRSAGVPVIWTAHNLVHHESHWPRLERFFMQDFLGLCTRIIVHGQGAITELEHFLNAPVSPKTRFVPMGNFCGTYPVNSTRDASRKKLSIRPDAFVFLFFGSIRKYKNVPSLVSAFRRNASERDVLLVAGKPREDSLASEIGSRADGDKRIRLFLDYVPTAEVQHYLLASDVLVLPFADILTSASAILGLSFGRPMVAPYRGCLRDLVDAGVAIPVEGPRVAEISEALQRAKTVDLETMGRRARHLAESWSWDVAGELTAQVYEDAMSEDLADKRIL
ncbi:MAG: glycosyltransferase [bacterium]|nr:glycosyltransferase [bacterium]